MTFVRLRTLTLFVVVAASALPAGRADPNAVLPAPLPVDVIGTLNLGRLLPNIQSGTPVPAFRCGFTAQVGGEATQVVPIQVYVQYPLFADAETDEGVPTVTYDPETNLSTFTVTGQKWGLSVSSDGSGVVTQYGVPYAIVNKDPDDDFGITLPTDLRPVSTGVARANTGCSEDGLTALCWGDGYGRTGMSLYSVVVQSRYNHC